MPEKLNTPERVINNIRTASVRMEKIDKILGEQRLQYFAEAISGILLHIEPSMEGLNGVLENREIQVEVTIQLINAATELETAWNAIRLGNIPASQRQTRVAFELVAVAVLMALPITELKHLPRKVPIARCLNDHPGKTVIDCYKPNKQYKNGIEEIKPLLDATDFFVSFLMVSESILGIPKQITDTIRDYRKQIQNPASHGSAELFIYHFEAFHGAAGAFFDEERTERFVYEADEISYLTHLLVEILGHLTLILSKDLKKDS